MTDEEEYQAGPPVGWKPPPVALAPPATRAQRDEWLALARVNLAAAAFGTPCGCGCGPAVHVHNRPSEKWCGLCGREACAVYRKGAGQAA